MKNIIVPIDFSPLSEAALEVAAVLAKKKKSELLVLHMLELTPYIMSTGDNMPTFQIVHLLKHTEKRLAKFLDRPSLQGLKVTPIIKHYKVFDEIDDVAKSHGADLIVMGSNGTTGIEEIFIGSNTERVVRDAEIPVLVIKTKIENFAPKSFVFACDFKEESLPAFRKARDFAALLNVDLSPVFINTPGDSFQSSSDINALVSTFMNKANIGLEVAIYNDYNVRLGILNYAKDISADLIGIPTHGRKGLAHFFMGSIGEDVANHSKIPVITFKI